MGNLNENGQRLLELCSAFHLCLADTYFAVSMSSKVTWMHPRSRRWHQLYHVILRRRQLNEVNHCLFFRFEFLVTAVSGRPKPEICPLPGRFWVNTLAQGVLRQFTQWTWIEHPTFQLRGGHFTTELVPTSITVAACILRTATQIMHWSLPCGLENFIYLAADHLLPLTALQPKTLLK